MLNLFVLNHFFSTAVCWRVWGPEAECRGPAPVDVGGDAVLCPADQGWSRRFLSSLFHRKTLKKWPEHDFRLLCAFISPHYIRTNLFQHFNCTFIISLHSFLILPTIQGLMYGPYVHHVPLAPLAQARKRQKKLHTKKRILTHYIPILIFQLKLDFWRKISIQTHTTSPLLAFFSVTFFSVPP